MRNVYNKKLEDMWEFCNDAFDSPEDLTTFLEISMEDLIMAFPEKLVELHSKIFVPLDEDEDDVKEKTRKNETVWYSTGTEEDLWD
jgi:hypothetical protein